MIIHGLSFLMTFCMNTQSRKFMVQNRSLKMRGVQMQSIFLTVTCVEKCEESSVPSTKLSDN